MTIAMDCRCVLPALCLLFVVVATETQYSHTIFLDATDPSAKDSSQCWEDLGPCKTLNFALVGAHHANSTEVRISKRSDGYSYDLRAELNATVFRWANSVAITGTDGNDTIASVENAVSVTCSTGAGLSFLYSTAVVITGVQFYSCGAKQVSTSKNYTSKNESFSLFTVGLYFLFCQEIEFHAVGVSNSLGTGVTFYGTTGSNMLADCLFENNEFQKNVVYAHGGGGGVYIEYPYCNPLDPSCFAATHSPVPLRHVSNAVFTILRCTFSNNIANLTNSNSYAFIFPKGTNHISFGRGGGLCVFFKGKAQSNLVTVHNCTFTKNKAVWGGGVLVEHQDSSYNNSFVMNSTIVDENECFYDPAYSQGTGGGGVRVDFAFFSGNNVSNNKMIFINIQFLQNTAYFGGGFSMYASREPNRVNSSNGVQFINCLWHGNRAKLGAAVDFNIFGNGPSGVPPISSFTDCSFINNSVKSWYGTIVGDIVGQGILYTDSIPIFFSGSVEFSNNLGGALFVIDTSVDIRNNSLIRFKRNHAATNGGALSLVGHAFLRIHNSSKVFFIENHARQRGGAVYFYAIGYHTLLGFGTCFVRYQDDLVPTDEWNFEVNFIGNTAGFDGHSMYATSLLPCVVGYLPHARNQSVTDFLFCGHQWNYDGDNCTNISSAPAQYTNVSGDRYIMSIIPGFEMKLPIEMIDDEGHNVTKSLVLNAFSLTENTTVSDSSNYISDSKIKLEGNPGTTGAVEIQTLGPRVLVATVDVAYLQCPPGYILNGRSCSSRSTYGNTVFFNGKKPYLKRGFWLGMHNLSNGTIELLSGMFPYSKQAFKHEQKLPLPNSNQDLDSLLCSELNRRNILCGECIPNYSPTMHSGKCVKCSDSQVFYGWIIWILFKIFPLTVFFCILMFFNISVTRGPGNGFIFFAQIITATFDIEGDGTTSIQSVPIIQNSTTVADILRGIYVTPYEIWNLNFLSLVLPPFCVSPHLSTLGLISMEYIVGFFPLVLILLYYSIVLLYERGIQPIFCLCRPVHMFLAQLRRKWNVHRSILDAFATFLVVSYMKLAITSVYLITPISLRNQAGRIAYRTVYYDGTVPFLSKEHIPFFLLSILILVGFLLLPALLLLLYPCKAFHRLLNCCKLHKLCKFNDDGRMKLFLETFYGCYRDGLDGSMDCRYFAGVYFILRFLFSTVYIYTGLWIRQYMVQQLICTGAMLFIAVVKPYKNNLYNVIDTTILAIISAINACSMYNFYYAAVEEPLSSWTFVVQYMLILCPLVYMTIYLSSYLMKEKKIIEKFCKCFKRRDQDTAEDPSVMIDDEREPLLPGNNDDDDFIFNLQQTARDREHNTYVPSTNSTNSSITE